jgi:hypothetical protein
MLCLLGLRSIPYPLENILFGIEGKDPELCGILGTCADQTWNRKQKVILPFVDATKTELPTCLASCGSLGCAQTLGLRLESFR